jgi:hypothetical protein
MAEEAGKRPSTILGFVEDDFDSWEVRSQSS